MGWALPSIPSMGSPTTQQPRSVLDGSRISALDRRSTFQNSILGRTPSAKIPRCLLGETIYRGLFT